ncbi:PRAME family member 12 [Heterocephalus glaber]|uniref:PRAME family member 12 n=1 Tax=Heterocephalus glaber TaxID=10181 RepID=G5AKX6_HETGA|nr:PRAME family member 12 [Heterocephalus glaber]
MSTQSPPTLLQLAVQSLLRDKDVAVGVLEDFPGELFPPLCKEAFTRGTHRGPEGRGAGLALFLAPPGDTDEHHEIRDVRHSIECCPAGEEEPTEITSCAR